MKKLFKTIIKFVIIAIVLLAVLKACFGKDDKPEPKYEEPQVVEKQEDSKPIEEQPQEVVEEREPDVELEVDVEEQPREEVVDQNGIRPEFQKSMESYEEFFDEYIEFMSSFKYEDAGLSTLAKYTEFLTKYEKAMSEMDKIDESELTEAEDKLFLETQLRINNKLAEAAISY